MAQETTPNAAQSPSTPQGWLDIHVHYTLPFHSKQEAKDAVAHMRENNFLIDPNFSWSIEFGRDELHCDGFWVNPICNSVKLSDPSLDAVWARLDELNAVVWAHPDPSDPSVDGRPGALMEVTYEMQRVIIDQIYRRHFLRLPHVRHVYANCAGGFLANVGRLEMVGTEDWVPNPTHVTKDEIEEQARKLWVDIAAAAEDGVGVSVKHLGAERVVFGSDTGAPCMCMNVETMEVNRRAMLKWERELRMEEGMIGMNGWRLFPEAVVRAARGS